MLGGGPVCPRPATGGPSPCGSPPLRHADPVPVVPIRRRRSPAVGTVQSGLPARFMGTECSQRPAPGRHFFAHLHLPLTRICLLLRQQFPVPRQRLAKPASPFHNTPQDLFGGQQTGAKVPRPSAEHPYPAPRHLVLHRTAPPRTRGRGCRCCGPIPRRRWGRRSPGTKPGRPRTAPRSRRRRDSRRPPRGSRRRTGPRCGGTTAAAAVGRPAPAAGSVLPEADRSGGWPGRRRPGTADRPGSTAGRPEVARLANWYRPKQGGPPAPWEPTRTSIRDKAAEDALAQEEGLLSSHHHPPVDLLGGVIHLAALLASTPTEISTLVGAYVRGCCLKVVTDEVAALLTHDRDEPACLGANASGVSGSPLQWHEVRDRRHRY